MTAADPRAARERCPGCGWWVEDGGCKCVPPKTVELPEFGAAGGPPAASEREVMIAKRGQLKPATKRLLAEAGILVVEVDDLEAVRFVRSGQTVTGDDMVIAALRGLNAVGTAYGETGRFQRDEFVAALHQIMEAKVSRG